MNEDPELLRSERERKRAQGQLKRSAQETRRGQGKQSASSLPATGRRLVALRSNPSAGAPLVPRSSRGNPIASGAGETAVLSVASSGTGVPEDELPHRRAPVCDAALLARARALDAEINRREEHNYVRMAMEAYATGNLNRSHVLLLARQN